MLRAPVVALLIASLAGCAGNALLASDGSAGSDALMKLAANVGGECNVPVDATKTQYLIGYGSLMQEQSRKRSMPTVDKVFPVDVEGYRRGWFAKGGSAGLDTTYLGAVPDEGSRLNAVIFVVNPADIPVMDKREYFYCRIAVKDSSYKLLKPEDTPVISGQAWIYVNRPESIAVANARFPIVQSYVDIFVSGCQEQEDNYALKDFAAACLATTTEWSTAWVNDRIYPRRPFIYQPKAGQIDKLLKEKLPDFFKRIHFEAAN